MSRKLLLDRKFCQVHLDESNGILYCQWIGFLTPETVREGGEFMLKVIKEQDIKLHLSDHRSLKVMMDDVKEYVTKEWFAKAEAVGLRRVAALVSENIFARSSIAEVNEKAQIKLRGLTIDTFNIFKECEDWLTSPMEPVAAG